MPNEIVWLDQAKDDIREILEYISRENSVAAAKYVAELASSCARLAVFPNSGRRYSNQFRVLIFRNHHVFYSFDKEARSVAIAMVVDGRRDIERLLEGKSSKA